MYDLSKCVRSSHINSLKQNPFLIIIDISKYNLEIIKLTNGIVTWSMKK